MPSLPAQIPVVIIGAGPTGLTAALLLASYGVRSVIVERADAPLDIPRAIVLDDEGARTLQVFGADKTYVEPLTVEGDGAMYVDDGGVQFARVGAGPETFGFPKRHFINQPELEAVLRQHVAQQPMIGLYFSTEATAAEQDHTGVTVTVQGPDGHAQSLRAAYVIAADGGRSPMRERLGIEMIGSTYAQDWIVVDTLNDPNTKNASVFICSDKRPHVSIPAPRGGRRYEFMLLPGETHQDGLADGFVEGLLAPFRTIDPADIVRKTIYTFHARIARRWRKGRIFLAGDAAHLTPPFAGQGMNAGLRDAANISWKLAVVLNGAGGEALLETYQSERNDPAWAMIQLAVAMGDIVMPIDAGRLAFREHLLESLKQFPAVQDYLLKMKFKPPPRFDTGAFLGLGQQAFEGSVVGDMIAQPTVQMNQTTYKLDHLLGVGFALIAQDAAGARALAALEQMHYAGLPLAKLYLPFGPASHDFPAATTDDDRAKLLRAHRDQIMLIRPDRYCAAAFSPDRLEQMLDAYLDVLV